VRAARSTARPALDGFGLVVPSLQAEPFELLAVEPSPCTQACPAGINVKSYVSLIAEGRFAEALEVVRERCPLPGICGRICHHPCESVCKRQEIDEPVAIRALKRFVADLGLELPDPPPPIPAHKSERVAIIGSGPAGLAAAYDLRRAGYPVTVFEAEPEAGGMLRYGIADYRLPPDVLDAEIGVLERAGVEIETGQRIGVDRTLEDLLESDYSAVLFAVGVQKGRRLGLEDEAGCAEVEDALAFLRRVNEGERTPVSGKVLVIGGGSTAIEAARAALRLGAESVEVVYRRLRAEMPADEEEIDIAAAEGITFRFLTSPKRVVNRKGRLASLECLQVALGEEDASGRRRPITLPGSEFRLDADRVFAAVGQVAEFDFLPPKVAGRLAEGGLLSVDSKTSMTALHGVFAAGDVVSGPATVIEAIASGHRAAEAMLGFLTQGMGEREDEGHGSAAKTEYEIPAPPPPLVRRFHPVHAEITPGREFGEVEHAFSPDDAVAEAKRCMRCGPCSECLICASSCGRRHLSLLPIAQGGTRIPRDEPGQGPLLLRAPARVVVGLGYQEGAQDGDDGAVGWLVTDLATRGSAPVDPEVDLTVSLTPSRVVVDPEHCRGCARCIDVCSFDALGLVEGSGGESVVRIEPALCRGCNLCAGVCPTDAITSVSLAPEWWGVRFEDLYPRLLAAPPTQPATVVLACQRRANAVEASLAREGVLGTQAILVPVRCAGQIPAGRLLEIYRHGAADVVVAGCLSGSCRYGLGPQLAAGQVMRAGEVLSAMGLERNRITADWAAGEDEGLDFEFLNPAMGDPSSIAQRGEV